MIQPKYKAIYSAYTFLNVLYLPRTIYGLYGVLSVFSVGFRYVLYRIFLLFFVFSFTDNDLCHYFLDNFNTTRYFVQ